MQKVVFSVLFLFIFVIKSNAQFSTLKIEVMPQKFDGAFNNAINLPSGTTSKDSFYFINTSNVVLDSARIESIFTRLYNNPNPPIIPCWINYIKYGDSTYYPYRENNQNHYFNLNNLNIVLNPGQASKWFVFEYTVPSVASGTYFFSLNGKAYKVDSFYNTKPFGAGLRVRNWGVSNQEVSEQNLAIFPNPATDFIQIKEAELGAQLQVYDMWGRLLLQQIIRQEQESIFVQNLDKGIYLLVLQNKNGSRQTAKLVKE